MSKRNQEDEDNQDLELISSVSKRRKVWRDGEDEDGRRPFSMASTRMFSHDDYTAGWISALPLEMAAAKAMLDEIHADLKKLPNDNNTYTLGRIGEHNIVIACLPSGVYGTTSAATVAGQMLSSFGSIHFWLMVGIGGGVPSKRADIRLGDIVVSIPTPKFEGVVQYDYGKTVREGWFERTGTLNKPPPSLLTAVAKLQADHELMSSRIPTFLSEMLSKQPDMAAKYAYRGRQQDLLFETEYDHVEYKDACEGCDKKKLVARSPRDENNPIVHYGLIASGNQVMKHGCTRDRLARELGILCFEMEAAGLMDNFPCLVIRGICDYADSHKNKQWQRYAAATAAAYAKELLSVIPATQAAKTPVVFDATSDANVKQRRILMDALRFDQIYTRQATIKTAHDKTCKWLLRKSEYCDWLGFNKVSEHHGFLWIKGKPGTGKSTIMKFALKDAKKTIIEEEIIVSFFFNARGEDLEKSTIGMYRSLLFQLLEKVPELQNVLDSQGSPLVPGCSDHRPWNVEILKDLFQRAVEKFRQQRLMCFIDALDECEEDQVRDMVDFFEHLGQLAVSARIRLHVCFSSRLYPNITIKKGRQLILEHQEGHDQDIANYLYSELKAGNSKQVEQVRTEILEKASGIFLWVVLVVQILNKEYDRGRMHALRKRLQELPTKLNELFKDILTRDDQNMEDLLLCIQWILYAKRPLTREELYFAILSGEAPEALTAWNPEEITKQDMERFILSSSKGLAEVTKSTDQTEVTKSTDQTVQFIHESVRDFLLAENGLSDLSSVFGGKFRRLSHERLKQCCYNYMKINIHRSLPITTPLPIASTVEAADLRGSASKKFPFLEYAVRNVLYHADVAERSGFPQDAFIKNFPLRDWLTLDNLIEKYQIRRHTPKASLLYIFAERNLPNLIKIWLRRVLNMDIEGERYSFPIFAALANGNENAVRALLMPDPQSYSDTPQDLYSQYHQVLNTFLENKRDIKPRKGQTLLSYAAEHDRRPVVRLLLATRKVDINARDREGRTPLSWVAKNGNEAAVKLLLEKDAEIESKDSEYGQTPLSHAAQYGHEAVVKLLLENGAEIESMDSEYRQTPLSWAAENGREAVVKLLLEKGAGIESRDSAGQTPLSWATRNGHEAVVKLLLEKSAELESKDSEYGQTPLLWAVKSGRQAVVKLLLEKGSEIESKDSEYRRTPLSWAAENGCEAVVKLLLEKGAEIESRDSKYRQTPLSWAAEKGHEAVVKLLLENSAELESKDSEYGQTPLSWAARNGREAVVKLLLENGAELESKDSKYGQTPLSWAARNSREAVVKLLLEKGARIESRDSAGQTPLLYATQYGHEAVVKLLLEKGDRIESKNSAGQTPLSCAAQYGHEAVVKLLLEKGAGVESRDSAGQTPLLWAARYGHEAVVKLLLKRGAGIESKDSEYGQTPLSWAARNGREAVVKLLLEKGARIESRNSAGQTPLSCAAQCGHEAAAKLLLEKGAELESEDSKYRQTPLLWAARYGHEAVVKLLLEKGNGIESRNSAGQTPLSCTAQCGHEAVAKLLLEKGAELESKDSKYGQTPLSWAARNGREAVVKLLLEKGARIESRNSAGQTPLSCAAQCGHEAVAKLLLEKCAELESKDSRYGQTPLLWAAGYGHEAVVKLLLKKGAEIESKDSAGQTPLSWARRNGCEVVVKLLLKKGAKKPPKT